MKEAIVDNCDLGEYVVVVAYWPDKCWQIIHANCLDDLLLQLDSWGDPERASLRYIPNGMMLIIEPGKRLAVRTHCDTIPLSQLPKIDAMGMLKQFLRLDDHDYLTCVPIYEAMDFVRALQKKELTQPGAETS